MKKSKKAVAKALDYARQVLDSRDPIIVQALLKMTPEERADHIYRLTKMRNAHNN